MAHRCFYHVLWVVVGVAGNWMLLKMVVSGSPIDFVDQRARFPVGWHLLLASLLLRYHNFNFHFNCRNEPKSLLKWSQRFCCCSPFYRSFLPWTWKQTSKRIFFVGLTWKLKHLTSSLAWLLESIIPLFFLHQALCICEVHILESRHESLVHNNLSATVLVLLSGKQLQAAPHEICQCLWGSDRLQKPL